MRSDKLSPPFNSFGTAAIFGLQFFFQTEREQGAPTTPIEKLEKQCRNLVLAAPKNRNSKSIQRNPLNPLPHMENQC